MGTREELQEDIRKPSRVSSHLIALSPAMATTAPRRPTDDFDMTKLQKSLKQRQRQSVRNSPHVAKLTAAEVRSLNHSALASTTGSQSSSKGTSPVRSRRATNATPPASLDHPSAPEGQNHKNSFSRSSSRHVPTPPITPRGVRRSSQCSTRGPTPTQGQAHGPIQSPRPRGSAQAAFMVANGISSRPSSSGSSTYRGLSTYRGPEVTRTGSMNMLQRPPPDIVANPLSYFSRPRQSVVSASPDRCRHDSQDSGATRPLSFGSSRTNSLHSLNGPCSRPVSPPRATDSPVSMLLGDTEKIPVLDASDPHNQPKIQDDDEPNNPKHIEQAREENNGPPASAAVRETQVEQSESPKKDPKKRFSIGVALFVKERKSPDGSDNSGKLKKNRRRTLSSAKEHDTESPMPEEITHNTPVEEVKLDRESIESGDFATHPAVRPLSLIIPGEFKGKQKEIDAGPVFARCDCCGKLKRPPGCTSELSPVFENENLRTNFSFEIERTSSTMPRRSSDASRDKFTPIIPITVGEHETRQATVEPYKAPVDATSQPPPLKMTSPRRSKRHTDPPRFVRFGSLHGRRNTDPTIIDEEDEVDVEASAPLIGSQPATDIKKVKFQDLAIVEEVVSSRPVIEDGADHASVDVQLGVSSPVIGPPTDEPQRPTPESQFLNFSRPARDSTLRVQHQPHEQQTLTQVGSSAEQPASFLSLPEPSFGPHFARSNSILRSFVWDSGKPVEDHDSAVGMDVAGLGPATGHGAVPTAINQHRAQLLESERQKGQKWVTEVMAV